MNIYVVCWRGEVEDFGYHIIGAYSSQEKAQDAAERAAERSLSWAAVQERDMPDPGELLTAFGPSPATHEWRYERGEYVVYCFALDAE